ncbi:hypothetical protein B0H19DRAFT_1113469 [Mycena capillaripes]|nr:hypothetical protein B0H19DRAFT_1113469 [Mycena capillaripes]
MVLPGHHGQNRTARHSGVRYPCMPSRRPSGTCPRSLCLRRQRHHRPCARTRNIRLDRLYFPPRPVETRSTLYRRRNTKRVAYPRVSTIEKRGRAHPLFFARCSMCYFHALQTGVVYLCLNKPSCAPKRYVPHKIWNRVSSRDKFRNWSSTGSVRCLGIRSESKKRSGRSLSLYDEMLPP